MRRCGRYDLLSLCVIVCSFLSFFVVGRFLCIHLCFLSPFLSELFQLFFFFLYLLGNFSLWSLSRRRIENLTVCDFPVPDIHFVERTKKRSFVVMTDEAAFRLTQGFRVVLDRLSIKFFLDLIFDRVLEVQSSVVFIETFDER